MYELAESVNQESERPPDQSSNQSHLKPLGHLKTLGYLKPVDIGIALAGCRSRLPWHVRTVVGHPGLSRTFAFVSLADRIVTGSPPARLLGSTMPGCRTCSSNFSIEIMI
jgi:hypothetical protein